MMLLIRTMMPTPLIQSMNKAIKVIDNRLKKLEDRLTSPHEENIEEKEKGTSSVMLKQENDEDRPR